MKWERRGACGRREISEAERKEFELELGFQTLVGFSQVGDSSGNSEEENGPEVALHVWILGRRHATPSLACFSELSKREPEPDCYPGRER